MMKVSMNKETIVMKTSLALILFALAGLQAPGLGQEIEHVAKVEDELVVTAGARRRALKLPRRLARLA